MSKRRAGAQLTDRDDPDVDELGEDDGQPWQKASAEQMAGRKVVVAKRRGQNAEPPPMNIPKIDLPDLTAAASGSVPAFSFTNPLVPSTAAASAPAFSFTSPLVPSTPASDKPVFSFATADTKPEDVKTPAFSFPPLDSTNISFSFAPIANLTDKKAKEGEEEKASENPASPKKEAQVKKESPVKAAQPSEKKEEAKKEEPKEEKKDDKKFDWPVFSSTFKPVTSVEGVPAPKSPWPEYNFASVASSSPSSTPFKFDSNTSLLSAAPFNFAAFVQKAAEKNDEEGSGSDDGEGDEEATGVSSGVFGKDVKAPTGSSEELPVPANAPPPTLEKKAVVTGEESETTAFSTRGKLFVFESAGEGKPATWRERGTGVVKINTTEGGKKARILMRADTTLRVLLNAAVLPTLKVTKPADKQIAFGAVNAEVEPGQQPKLQQFLVRLGNPSDQAELEKALNSQRDAVAKKE